MPIQEDRVFRLINVQWLSGYLLVNIDLFYSRQAPPTFGLVAIGGTPYLYPFTTRLKVLRVGGDPDTPIIDSLDPTKSQVASMLANYQAWSVQPPSNEPYVVGSGPGEHVTAHFFVGSGAFEPEADLLTFEITFPGNLAPATATEDVTYFYGQITWVGGPGPPRFIDFFRDDNPTGWTQEEIDAQKAFIAANGGTSIFVFIEDSEVRPTTTNLYHRLERRLDIFGKGGLQHISLSREEIGSNFPDEEPTTPALGPRTWTVTWDRSVTPNEVTISP